MGRKESNQTNKRSTHSILVVYSREIPKHSAKLLNGMLRNTIIEKLISHENKSQNAFIWQNLLYFDLFKVKIIEFQVNKRLVKISHRITIIFFFT